MSAALTVISQDAVRSVAACGVHVAAGHSVSTAFQSRTVAYKSKDGVKDSGLKPLLH